MTRSRLCITWSVLLLGLCLSCNSSDLVEPAYQANVDPRRIAGAAPDEDPAPLASSTGKGPTLSDPFATSAGLLSESRIEVSWKTFSVNESGFEVHRSIGAANGTFVLLGSTPAGVLSYSDGGLQRATEYCYQVRAFRKAGTKLSYSNFSRAACATTPPPPGGDLQVTSATTGIDLDPDGYTVRVDAGPAMAISIDGAVSFVGLAAGPHAVELRDVAGNCAIGGTNPRSFEVLSESTVMVGFEVTCELTTPPAAPSRLEAYARIFGPTLFWHDDAINEDGFKIERCLAGELGCADAGFVEIAQIPTLDSRNQQSLVSYSDNTIEAGRAYVYRVRAFNRAGDSDPSNEAIGWACSEETGC
jgi:hypothetical protein